MCVSIPLCVYVCVYIYTYIHTHIWDMRRNTVWYGFVWKWGIPKHVKPVKLYTLSSQFMGNEPSKTVTNEQYWRMATSIHIRWFIIFPILSGNQTWPKIPLMIFPEPPCSWGLPIAMFHRRECYWGRSTILGHTYDCAWHPKPHVHAQSKCLPQRQWNLSRDLVSYKSKKGPAWKHCFSSICNVADMYIYILYTWLYMYTYGYIQYMYKLR